MRDKTDDYLNYNSLLREGLYHVVRRILEQVAQTGIVGQHHFFITFDTRHPGVDMPAFLRHQYPENMTIVLQHQFSNLVVDQNGFSVKLTFSGIGCHLTVPYRSLRQLRDPDASFNLAFADEAHPSTAPPPAPGRPKPHLHLLKKGEGKGPSAPRETSTPRPEKTTTKAPSRPKAIKNTPSTRPEPTKNTSSTRTEHPASAKHTPSTHDGSRRGHENVVSITQYRPPQERPDEKKP